MRIFPELTGLRGVAALLIVMFHAYWQYVLTPGTQGTSQVETLAFGQYLWIGVDLFFVLSAFLLTLAFADRPAHRRASWGGFVASRWRRIAPPYYVALAISLGVLYVTSTQIKAADVVLHLLFLHSLSPEYFVSINPVFWTLGVEFHFYLAFPVMLAMLSSRRWPWALAAFAAIVLILRATTYNAVTGWLNWTFPAFLLHFAFGILAAKLLLHGGALRLRGGVLSAAGIFVMFASLVALDDPAVYSQGHDSHLANVLVRPLLGLGLAATILGITQTPGAIRSLLSARPSQYLGNISYSLYLFHLPVMMLLLRYPATQTMGFASWLVLATLLSVLVAVAAYPMIERPFLSGRQRQMAVRLPEPVETPVPRPVAA